MNKSPEVSFQKEELVTFAEYVAQPDELERMKLAAKYFESDMDTWVYFYFVGATSFIDDQNSLSTDEVLDVDNVESGQEINEELAKILRVIFEYNLGVRELSEKDEVTTEMWEKLDADWNELINSLFDNPQQALAFTPILEWLKGKIRKGDILFADPNFYPYEEDVDIEEMYRRFSGTPLAYVGFDRQQMRDDNIGVLVILPDELHRKMNMNGIHTLPDILSSFLHERAHEICAFNYQLLPSSIRDSILYVFFQEFFAHLEEYRFWTIAPEGVFTDDSIWARENEVFYQNINGGDIDLKLKNSDLMNIKITPMFNVMYMAYLHAFGNLDQNTIGDDYLFSDNLIELLDDDVVEQVPE